MYFVKGMSLSSISPNLVDVIWKDRPVRKLDSIMTLSIDIAGQTIGEKAKKIREEMNEKGANVLVVTALDEVACK